MPNVLSRRQRADGTQALKAGSAACAVCNPASVSLTPLHCRRRILALRVSCKDLQLLGEYLLEELRQVLQLVAKLLHRDLYGTVAGATCSLIELLCHVEIYGRVVFLRTQSGQVVFPQGNKQARHWSAPHKAFLGRLLEQRLGRHAGGGRHIASLPAERWLPQKSNVEGPGRGVWVDAVWSMAEVYGLSRAPAVVAPGGSTADETMPRE